MNILIGCERSGRVRNAFRKLGHNAFSCDLEPDDSAIGPAWLHPYHKQIDVEYAICAPEFFGVSHWDLIICHPPCTALCVAGNGTYGAGKARHSERLEAIEWTINLWNTACQNAKFVCFENPVGVLSKTVMGKPQYIQPWMFGHPETKKTGLWLHNLPQLEKSNVVEDQLAALPAKDKHKIWFMKPSKERSHLRSITYQGIADSMAFQWGCDD